MIAKIRNITRKKFVCSALVASSALPRFRGLMLRKKPLPILFLFPYEAIWPIHSLLVLFPFDAVYLDSHRRVCEILPSLLPWNPLIAPRSKSKYLLELPAGHSSILRKGDLLEWR